MIKRTCLFTLALVIVYWSIAHAQDHPMMDALANKVIQKYQQSSCEQLAARKEEPSSPKEQEAIQKLRENPQMRTAFINKVAAPIANKLFECRLIP